MSDQSLLDGIENGARLKIEKSSLVSDGLGLTASAAIPAAEDVFSKQQLLHIADNPHFSTTCDNCFMWLGDSVNLKTNTISAWNAMPILKKCSGCQVVRYCSNSCQRSAWKTYHKAECKIFAKKYIEDTFIRATSRLLCMRKLGTIGDIQWHWVKRMQSHREDYYHSDPGLKQTLSEVASKISGWTGMGESEETVQKLYCQIKLNHMTNTRMEGETTGITLDPLAAMMNHSCDPNAFCFWEGAKIRVRSLRPIGVGEEVTISYTDDTLARDTRREYLKRWFFDCACQKCAKNASDDVQKVPMGFNIEALVRAIQSFDFTQPEQSDSAIFGTGGPGVGWPADLQPIPNLHLHLAIAYRAKTMLFSDPATSPDVQLHLLYELRHRISLCFIGDPAIRPISTHPTRVVNLLMLVLLLRRIVFAQQDPSTFPGFVLQRAQCGMCYKYYSMKVCRDARISHGKDSPLAVAVTELTKREFSMAEDPVVALGGMKEGELQAVGQLYLRMLRWAGILIDG